MYTNKASSVSNTYENSITVTPIKVEITLSPQDRANANTTTNIGTSSIRVENDDDLKKLNNSMTTINSNFSTSTSGASLLNTSSCPTKEKLGKGNKQSMPRKPPPTIENFWPNILNEVQTAQMVDAKHQALPLARIKKIMKLDENAKMIAAEAPLLFAKACELFIQELTMRAWIHTEESKRRTLQRSDIAQAIANYDQFDFLIDIVPREDIKPSGHHRKHENSQTTTTTAQNTATATNTTSNASSAAQCIVTGATTIPGVPVEMISVTTLSNEPANTLPIPQVVATPAIATNNNAQTAHVVTTGQSPQQVQIIQQTSHHPTQNMQYFITLPGQSTGQPQLVHQLQLPQQQSQLTHSIGTPLTATGLNLITQQPQQLILAAAPSTATTGLSGMHASAHQHQTALFQNLAQQQHQQQQQQQHQQQQQVQLVQQVVVTPTGEIANMPIAINANQLNLLRLQMHQQQQQQQQHHQQQQQAQQPTQQIIIPTQLLSTQQLLQLQSQQHPQHPAHTHTIQQVQQQQHHHHHQQQHQQQPTNSIFIQHTTTHPAHQSSTTNPTNAATSGSASTTASSAASTSSSLSSISGTATSSTTSSTDNRNMNAIFRTNC